MLVHPDTRQAIMVDKPVGWGHITGGALHLKMQRAPIEETQMAEHCQYRDCSGVLYKDGYCAIHWSREKQRQKDRRRAARFQEVIEEAKRLNMSMDDLEERIKKNQPILPLVGRTRHTAQGYILVRVKRGKKGWRMQHVVIAEKALGKKLPDKAIVHHIDGNKSNNSNNNLVICEDQAYHGILHGRTNRLNKYGNADPPTKTNSYTADFSDL